MYPEIYAVKHKNTEIVNLSQSGGVFTALSDYILECNGAVYGCVLTKEKIVKHVRATNIETRNQMRGSKYVQSKLGDTFKEVKRDLEFNKFVLFSGTPCQIAGLKKYLGKEYDHLFCIDLLCHGVPSPLVLRDYLVWSEKRHKAKISKFIFRNKSVYGWNSHVESLVLENGRIKHSGIFRDLFYGHWILRPSCFDCQFKSIMRQGDVTIGDYWGIEKVDPDFSDNKGISLVMVNNIKGSELFNRAKDKLEYINTDIQSAMQPALEFSFACPDNREVFWSEYHNKPFKYIAKKYTEYGQHRFLHSLFSKK